MNVSMISITFSHDFPAFIALTVDLHAACPGRRSGFSVNTVSSLEKSCLGTATHVCLPVCITVTSLLFRGNSHTLIAGQSICTARNPQDLHTVSPSSFSNCVQFAI